MYSHWSSGNIVFILYIVYIYIFIHTHISWKWDTFAGICLERNNGEKTRRGYLVCRPAPSQWQCNEYHPMIQHNYWRRIFDRSFITTVVEATLKYKRKQWKLGSSSWVFWGLTVQLEVNELVSLSSLFCFPPHAVFESLNLSFGKCFKILSQSWL